LRPASENLFTDRHKRHEIKCAASRTGNNNRRVRPEIIKTNRFKKGNIATSAIHLSTPSDRVKSAVIASKGKGLPAIDATGIDHALQGNKYLAIGGKSLNLGN
jgi:hypothetical protein